MTNPTTEQLKQAKESAMEEFLALLFLCMTDHQKYRKIIKDVENNVLQKKVPFPKNISDACGYSMDGITTMEDNQCRQRQMM